MVRWIVAALGAHPRSAVPNVPRATERLAASLGSEAEAQGAVAAEVGNHQLPFADEQVGHGPGRKSVLNGRNDIEVNKTLETEEAVLYRKYTLAMLKRYFQLSMDLGRVPSVLGGQCFRAKVSSYRVTTFEDVVIFVSDMEHCLEKLDVRELEMLATIVWMDYTEDEAAKYLGLCERQVRRIYPESLDKLTAILLETKLLKPRLDIEQNVPPRKPVRSIKNIIWACAESAV